MSFIILLWKLFHTVFTLIYVCTNPINNFLNGIIKKKVSEFKKIFTTIANLDANSFDEKDINNINKQLGLKKDDDMSKMSGISQYLVNSCKSEKKSIKNLNKTKKLNTINENNNTDSNTDMNVDMNADMNADTNADTNADMNADMNINELIENNNLISNFKSSVNSTNSKEEIIEKANNINNIFSNDDTNEIDDISFTVTSTNT